jgi:thymidylate synthase
MISIEGLLEDEQGLNMGEMLTVNFRQRSHEFTFGVGMNFISYPLVLTPLV